MWQFLRRKATIPRKRLGFAGATAVAGTFGIAERQQRFVYLLRSEKDNRPYVGMTCDVQQRLATHNSGGSLYTAPYRPWRLVVSLEFPDSNTARQFERYLKSGSGRAFAKKHFV